MAFIAKFAGTCRKCGEPYEIGDWIAWIGKARGQRGCYWHAECKQVGFVPEEKKVEATVEATVETVEAEVKGVGHEVGEEKDLGVFGPLAAALMPYLDGKLKAAGAGVEDIVNQKIADLEKTILDLLSDQPITLNVTRPDGEVTRIKGAHESMPELLYYVSKRHHAYLFGPPGSGKSTAAKQVADGLGLEYGYISLNPQTPDSRILGFIDANGTYRATPFFKIYTEGGVFCIDECDNASPSLLTTLNSLLENGHGAFPNGIFPKHADFVLVATGNTAGRGANPMFPERRPFDSAFAERFTYLYWDYDTKLEKAIALSINPASKPWFDWILKTRSYCQKNHPRVLISPRASFKGAAYLLDPPLSIEQIAESVIWKGLGKDTVAQIVAKNPYPAIERSRQEVA